MNQKSKLVITLTAGIAIGAAASAANMLPQAPKKAGYVIADVEVTDLAAFQAYVAKEPETLKPFNARTIVRGKPVAKEGDTPKGSIVIIAFDSLGDPEKWYSCPEYSTSIPERQMASKSQVYLVEGVPQ
jgi:uncharacterized protein (DUF1330 family)